MGRRPHELERGLVGPGDLGISLLAQNRALVVRRCWLGCEFVLILLKSGDVDFRLGIDRVIVAGRFRPILGGGKRDSL